MPHISFHDVDREVYDAVNTLELHGPNKVWKELWINECQLIFFPGEWRYPPPDRPEQPDGVIAF